MQREFVWDSAKAASNKRKHGISFETASRVFADPNHISDLESHVDGEERWKTIGRIEHHLLVVVIHTNWDEEGIEFIRLISARLAERKERALYEGQFGQI
jgi:uncharacterized protein